MKISEGTKISELIRANPLAIEVIASIDPHFEKLRNPILRKVLASRVTIKDAAKIGGCDVNIFFDKLSTIGFEQITTKPDVSDEHVPSSFSLPNDAKVTSLDVRPDIETGKDPFMKILGAVNSIEEGEYLELLCSFEPAPLISILEGKKYRCNVKRDADLIYTYIQKLPGSEKISLKKSGHSAEFDVKLEQYKESLIVIDVRRLEMPGPMVAILKELETLPVDSALHVFHRRVPQFLVAELKLRNIPILIKEVGEENVELLIYR